MKKLALRLLVYALAAVAGIATARWRHRRSHGAVSVPVVSKPAPAKPRPATIVVTEVPAAPSPAKRARAVDLTRYSRFNFVARRPIDVPSPVNLPPPDAFVWKTPVADVSPPSPAGLPALVYPLPSAGRPAGREVRELSMAVYGETAGLFPSRVARGSVYDPKTWRGGFSPGSAGDLLLARRMIAETRKGNKRTRLAVIPFFPDRPSLLAWYCCAEAAEDAAGARLYTAPPGMRLHFYIRQAGKGTAKAPYLAAYDPVMTFGPFVNVGGGDVPAGDATFIDFYVLPAPRR